MLRAVADCLTENIEDDLADNEKEHAQSNMSQWPTVFQGVIDKHQLHDHVNEKEDGIEDVNDDKYANRVRGIQTTPSFKCE